MPGFPASKRDTLLAFRRRAAGDPPGGFQNAFSCWAAVYAKGGGQAAEAGAAVGGGLFEALLPDGPNPRSLTVTDRVVHAGREMDIVRVDPPDRLRMTITIAFRDERGG